MKKIVLAGAIVLVAAAAMFSSCAAKACECTYKYGDYSYTYTFSKAVMDVYARYFNIKNCKDWEAFINSDDYTDAEGEGVYTCK